MNQDIDPRLLQAADEYAARTRPVLVLPRATALPPQEAAGERLLVCKDGLYLQFKRAWIEGCVPLAQRDKLALPFGVAPVGFKLRCPPPPLELIQAFIQKAQAVLPNEHAAWLVWTEPKDKDDAEDLGEFELLEVASPHASPDSITLERPVLEAGTHLVIDIHSHGTGAAFFSSTDDLDDTRASEVILALVVGHVDRKPSFAMRLAACGEMHHVDPRAMTWDEGA